MQQSRTRIHWLFALCAATTVSITACGGGKNATTPTSQPAPRPTEAAAPADNEPGSAEHQPAATEPTATEPAASATLAEQRAVKALSLLTAFVGAAVAHRGDCDAAAAAMEQWLTDNRDIMTDAKQWDKDPEFKKLMDQKYKEKLMKAIEPLIEVAQACRGNQAFDAAMKRMSE